MSDNNLKVTTPSKKLNHEIAETVTFYLSHSYRLDGYKLGSGSYSNKLLSSPSLTCSVSGGCSIFADAPRSAEVDETKAALVNLVWALERFGGGASMMHPRLTRALSAARKLTTPDVGDVTQPALTPETPDRPE